jgi:hypothetical protein
MAKQTFTTGQVLTAAQMTSLQQTAMGGGSATTKTASYVLVAADAGTTVTMTSASATTITVNTALFAAGDTVYIQNLGAGVSTITAGTATVNTSASLALAQYEGGQLYFNSTSAAIFIKGAGAATASGKSFSLLSTTTVSTGTSYTVTGLSGYDSLRVIFKNIRVTDSGNNATKLQINSVTTGCTFYGSTVTPSSTFTYIVPVTDATAPFQIMGNGTAGGQDLNGYFYIDGANTAGVKSITQATFVVNSNGSSTGRIGTATSTDTAVVSSLTISTTGTAFTSNGQMLIYGAV